MPDPHRRRSAGAVLALRRIAAASPRAISANRLRADRRCRRWSCTSRRRCLAIRRRTKRCHRPDDLRALPGLDRARSTVEALPEPDLAHEDASATPPHHRRAFLWRVSADQAGAQKDVHAAEIGQHAGSGALLQMDVRSRCRSAAQRNVRRLVAAGRSKGRGVSRSRPCAQGGAQTYMRCRRRAAVRRPSSPPPSRRGRSARRRSRPSSAMSTQQLRRLELRAVFLLQRLGELDELLRAHAVDVGQRAAGEGREAEGEDRADIGLARIGDDAFLHDARRFQRDGDEEALLQLLDVDLVRRRCG